MCEHYVASGVCSDYPDWSIAAPGSETNLRIGYEYGRFVTGVEQQIEPHLIEPDLNEEAARSAPVVPDFVLEEKSMVTTSAEVHVYLFFISDCSTALVYSHSSFVLC